MREREREKREERQEELLGDLWGTPRNEHWGAGSRSAPTPTRKQPFGPPLLLRPRRSLQAGPQLDFLEDQGTRGCLP